ncbi:hypothetical protein J6590_078614 [Homalodisca vitripennis]|nr:hypothetical protein J6590_078614 [Homalodisca vitripennis]
MLWLLMFSQAHTEYTWRGIVLKHGTSEERVTDFVLSTSDAQNLGGFAVKGREAAEGDETQLLVELRHVYNVSFETFFN